MGWGAETQYVQAEIGTNALDRRAKQYRVRFHMRANPARCLPFVFPFFALVARTHLYIPPTEYRHAIDEEPLGAMLPLAGQRKPAGRELIAALRPL